MMVETKKKKPNIIRGARQWRDQMENHLTTICAEKLKLRQINVVVEIQTFQGRQ